ncbi:MAG: TonB-dependent receptor [Gammaproteobacteria bacterium]|nr:TonB-dependent receptor [Gammaproteobacteria bacterium]
MPSRPGGFVRYIRLLPIGLALWLALPAAAQEVNVFDYTLEQLADVIVTAQKREQNAQDVPVSVSTLQGEDLEVLNASGADVRQLSFRLPSLMVESSFGRTFPRFYLRGMGNTDFDLIASQPVSLIMDEVVLENPLLKGFPMFDMERVEVLRGPQGTLFGRNTPAGIVKLESRKPTRQLEGRFNLGYGDYGSVNVDGALNLPFGDKLAARFSAISQVRENWIDNRAPGFEKSAQLGGYDDKAARAQLSFRPVEDLELLLNYHQRDLDGNSRIFLANIIEKGSNDLVDGFRHDTVYQDAAARNTQSVKMRGGSLKLTYDLGSASLFYIGGHESARIFSVGDIDGGYGACFLDPAGLACAAGDADSGAYALTPFMGPGFIPNPSETGVGMPDHRQLTHELRLASNERGALDYQVGAFWFDEDLTIENFSFDTRTGGAQNGFSRQSMETASWGVFVSLDYEWTPDFSTVAGLRYSSDGRKWRGHLWQSPFGAPPFLSAAEVDDTQLSWDASASYRLDVERTLYARVARGYRAPSIQGRNLLFSGQPTTADSETLLSYEIGFKSEFLDRRARVNAALFHYRTDGQQLTAVGGVGNAARLLNAKETIGHGGELEAELVLTPKFIVSAGLSYNHTEINDPSLAVATCQAHCTVTDPVDPETGLASIDGNPLPQSPEWILDLSVRYGWDFGRDELYVLSDWAYRSELNFFLYETKEYRGAPVLEGGLRIGYVWPGDKAKMELALVGRNITNETALEGGIDFNNRAGYLHEPRYWGLEFKMAFQ